MKRTFLTLIVTLVALAGMAQESRTAYNFLRLPVSAHEAALGGENITITDDDQSLIFSNPALLVNTSDKTIGLNYMNYMSGVNTASAAFNRVVAAPPEASAPLPRPRRGAQAPRLERSERVKKWKSERVKRLT